MTDDKLREIAKGITTSMSYTHPAANFYGVMENLIVEALRTVHDEAARKSRITGIEEAQKNINSHLTHKFGKDLNSLMRENNLPISLPGKEEVSSWTTFFAQAQLDKDGYRANEWQTTSALMVWLRAQIRTAKPIDDEKLELEWCMWKRDTRPSIMESSLKDCFLEGFRAAEKHHGIGEK